MFIVSPSFFLIITNWIFKLTCDAVFCQLGAALPFHQRYCCCWLAFWCSGLDSHWYETCPEIILEIMSRKQTHNNYDWAGLSEYVWKWSCSFILHVNHSFFFQMLQDCAKARREVELHWRASPCANIVRIIDVYENLYQGRKCLLIVMEWWANTRMTTAFNNFI